MWVQRNSPCSWHDANLFKLQELSAPFFLKIPKVNFVFFLSKTLQFDDILSTFRCVKNCFLTWHWLHFDYILTTFILIHFLIIHNAFWIHYIIIFFHISRHFDYILATNIHYIATTFWIHPAIRFTIFRYVLYTFRLHIH